MPYNQPEPNGAILYFGDDTIPVRREGNSLGRAVMGFLDTIKGWFNIGGLKVQITDVENPFPADDTVMKGKFVLSTKTDKTVLGTSVEFFMEETTGKGEEKKTTKTTLGRQNTKDYLVNDQYPFELAANETKEISFLITDVHTGGMIGRMAEKGGMLGAMGKAASFASSFKDKGFIEYYVEVTADVKGSPFDPTDKVQIKVVPGKSS